MQIIGVSDRSGAVVFRRTLGHGEDPTSVGYGFGYQTLRPLGADRVGSDLELRLAVEEALGQSPPVVRDPDRDPDLVLSPGEQPRIFQRIAAYAVVTSTLGVLATEYSDRTAAAGRWGLPGGGIDPGEDPRAAVQREIVEETDQRVELGDLVGVYSGHWIGRSPLGDVEDFHAVRLIYTAECGAPTAPRVLDVGGTTESARWVPLAEWSTFRWTAGWRELLSRWLPVG